MTTAPAQEEKVILYNDEATYQAYKAKEDKFLSIFKELNEIAVTSLGVNPIPDYRVFLENPSEYLVLEYWNRYAQKTYPKHADKTHVYELSTRVHISTLNALKSAFDKLLLELRKYSPQTVKQGLKSNLNKEHFNKFLDPNKQKEYKALVSFLKSAEALKKYGSNGDIHLMRYSNKLQMVGLNAVISATQFV